MKHLLIAASTLAKTAGYAAADNVNFTFSGDASAGVGKYTGTDDSFHVYSNLDFTVSAKKTTDSGIEFGASFDASAGPSVDRGGDLDDGDSFGTNDGAFGTPTVYASGTFGKLEFSRDNIDFYKDGAYNGGGAGGDGDLKYSGTFGGFGVGMVVDVESGDLAAQATYTVMGVALSADYNQNGADTAIWEASAGYTLGSFTATAAADNDTGTFDTEESLKLAYAMGSVSAWAKASTNDSVTATSFDVGGTFASGPMSLTVEADDVTAATGTMTWKAYGSYDVGAGLALEAGTNDAGDVYAGAKMSF